MMWKKMFATQVGSTISVKMRSLFSYCEAYMDGDARARMLMPQVMELNESKNEKPFFPSGAIFSLRCYSCVTPDFGLSSTGS